MSVDSNYKDLLRAFDRHGVRYLIAGGFAVILYTEPRFTKDLDVWVDPTMENAARVVRALSEFGAPIGAADTKAFTALGSEAPVETTHPTQDEAEALNRTT